MLVAFTVAQYSHLSCNIKTGLNCPFHTKKTLIGIILVSIRLQTQYDLLWETK